ncbi:MAG: YebC/PmpR family DNA-binding transcriptional regulator [Elusimicrobiota bacterium]
MSGHSRWAGIKHKKAAIDSQRGKVFTRIIREIAVAARQGGGNPENNARLRKVMEMARESNMPQENIKKALQRGMGELPGMTYEELVYEGYGPGGAAIICEATTDNKNRSASEIRKIFSSHGGNMGEGGCVSWMFAKRGYFTVNKKNAKEDDLLSLVLESGAEDMKTEDADIFEIITDPADFEKVKTALESKNILLESAEITLVANTYIPLEGKEAEQMLALMEDLEGHDDVSNVYANFDISEEFIERYSTSK